jgi:hypothetical protein
VSLNSRHCFPLLFGWPGSQQFAIVVVAAAACCSFSVVRAKLFVCVGSVSSIYIWDMPDTKFGRVGEFSLWINGLWINGFN